MADSIHCIGNRFVDSTLLFHGDSCKQQSTDEQNGSLLNTFPIKNLWSELIGAMIVQL